MVEYRHRRRLLRRNRVDRRLHAGIAAPALGGYLLSIGMKPPKIFLSACVFAVIAAAATAVLKYRGSRAAQLSVGEPIP